ncbi:MAG: hypothetical protein NTX32_06650 [Candidatus Firestonebacteria bacterium]|nr:hypothetical protein [Candidatus Firestonebacteria bacterium]
MLKKIMFVLFCAVFLSGCYFTIEPIYTEKDKISDDGIVGKWGQVDKKGSWQFSKDEKGNTYTLVLGEGINNTSIFTVTLVKIGKYKYLDMLADNKRVENQNSDFKALLLGCHSFFRYSIENNKIVVTQYDLAWLEKRLKTKKLNLHYFDRREGFYFSDSTEDLQKAIIAIEDKEEAFLKDKVSLERVK